MTADVPAPPVQRARVSQRGRFPSGRYRGGHRRQRLLPSGRSRRCSAGRVVLMRPQTSTSSPAPADPPEDGSPTRGSGGRGFRPFAVHRQPQGSVSSEVHAPVADNRHLFAAQVVPAAVDEGFICRRCASHWTQCASRRTGRRFSSAPPGALGSIRSTSLTRCRCRAARANKLVTQGVNSCS